MAPCVRLLEHRNRPTSRIRFACARDSFKLCGRPALLSRQSLDTMWTPFVLNDDKPNPSHYGFGWVSDGMNGHRVVQHTGSWQGLTCTITGPARR